MYLAFAASLPHKEFDTWGGSIAEYGHWSLLVILFPEINRMFVSQMTLDNLTTVEVTRGFGWALFGIWSLVTMAIWSLKIYSCIIFFSPQYHFLIWPQKGAKSTNIKLQGL